jgi:hypothetical protein
VHHLTASSPSSAKAPHCGDIAPLQGGHTAGCIRAGLSRERSIGSSTGNCPPVLSSGLREATPAQTSVTSKLSQRPATPTLFDAASLPPIESIGAGSDIRPFLEPGVPQDLARAALHRAWAADPAIRDFIGLSENSSDFNAPDAVPGFGSLTTHDGGRLPARVPEELLGASGDGATSPNKSGR